MMPIIGISFSGDVVVPRAMLVRMDHCLVHIGPITAELKQTRFNKIAIQGRGQMASDKEAIGLSRVQQFL